MPGCVCRPYVLVKMDVHICTHASTCSWPCSCVCKSVCVCVTISAWKRVLLYCKGTMCVCGCLQQLEIGSLLLCLYMIVYIQMSALDSGMCMSRLYVCVPVFIFEYAFCRCVLFQATIQDSKEENQNTTVSCIQG